LGIARVIHGFHDNNLLHKVVVVRMDMLDQLKLGVPRADDQNLPAPFMASTTS